MCDEEPSIFRRVSALGSWEAKPFANWGGWQDKGPMGKSKPSRDITMKGIQCTLHSFHIARYCEIRTRCKELVEVGIG